MMHVSTSSLLTAAAVAALLAGCAQPPRGSYSGRVDTNYTTVPETQDARILPVALMEASSQAAQTFVQELADLPEIGAQGAPGGRSVVILGDINNKTGIVSTDEFEMTKKRIRSDLINSRYVRSKVQWVENRARLANIAAREGVGDTEVPAGPDAYPANHTFALNMDVFRINRGPVNQYYLEVHLTSFKTNEIILSKRYEIKQIQ